MTWVTRNEFSRCYFCTEFCKFNDTAPQPGVGRKNILYSYVYVFGHCIVQINCAWFLSRACHLLSLKRIETSAYMVDVSLLQMQQCLMLPTEFLYFLTNPSLAQLFYDFQHLSVLLPALLFAPPSFFFFSHCCSISLATVFVSLFLSTHDDNSGTGTHPNGKH